MANAVLRHSLTDEAGQFHVTVVDAAEPERLVLFAVGGGGNPERHLPLLRTLADHGSTVVAPHFARLVAPTPSSSDLLLRARRLCVALEATPLGGLPVSGVGHSIGATMLLALAGGCATMATGEVLCVAREVPLDRLVLFAPAARFYYPARALDAVRIPILVWAGTKDSITPPEQAEFLTHALGTRLPIEVRMVEGTDHFSFMHERPPQTADPLPQREKFLADLTAEVCRFVAGTRLSSG